MLTYVAITCRVMNVRRRKTSIIGLKTLRARETPCCYLIMLAKARLHFLWVYWRNKPTWDVRRTLEKLENHES